MIKLLRLGIVVFILLLSALMPLTARTSVIVTPPDTLEIYDARAWQHLLKPHDLLMIISFDIGWQRESVTIGNYTQQVIGNITIGNQSSTVTLPVTQTKYTIDRTFTFGYTDSGSISRGNGTAYPFFNLGYVRGIAAIYWEEDDEDKPEWGDLGNVTITGTNLFSSPPFASYTLTEDDWAEGTTAAAQREDLRQWLVNQLTVLQVDWNDWAVDHGYADTQLSLVTAGGEEYYVASSDGQAYLGLSIDNITKIVPLLFMSVSTAISHTEGEWELAQQNIYESQYEGTQIEIATEAAGDLIGTSGIWAVTLFVLAGGIGLVILCQAKWQRLNNGLLLAYIVILISTPNGMFQMGMMALFAVIAVLYISDIFISKRAA